MPIRKRRPGFNRPYYNIAYAGCPGRRGVRAFETTCRVCLFRAGKTRLWQRREGGSLEGEGEAPTRSPELAVDVAEEGDFYMRTRRRKLKAVRDTRQVEGYGFHGGRGKHPKGPGARPKRAGRDAAVADALQHADLYRQRQAVQPLGPYDIVAKTVQLTEGGLRDDGLGCEGNQNGAEASKRPILGETVLLRRDAWAGGTVQGRVVASSPLMARPQGGGGACYSCSNWDEISACPVRATKCEVVDEERQERGVRVALRQHFAARQARERRSARDAKTLQNA